MGLILFLIILNYVQVCGYAYTHEFSASRGWGTMDPLKLQGVTRGCVSPSVGAGN